MMDYSLIYCLCIIKILPTAETLLAAVHLTRMHVIIIITPPLIQVSVHSLSVS